MKRMLTAAVDVMGVPNIFLGMLLTVVDTQWLTSSTPYPNNNRFFILKKYGKNPTAYTSSCAANDKVKHGCHGGAVPLLRSLSRRSETLFGQKFPSPAVERLGAPRYPKVSRFCRKHVWLTIASYWAKSYANVVRFSLGTAFQDFIGMNQGHWVQSL